jgi:hypothetical protein
MRAEEAQESMDGSNDRCTGQGIRNRPVGSIRAKRYSVPDNYRQAVCESFVILKFTFVMAM